MTTGLDHPLVADYLKRLDDAAGVLPPARRAELVAEIRSHLAEGLRETGGTEAEIQNMLQRLGSPADIVAEEDDGARPQAVPATSPGGPPVLEPQPPGTWLEISAVLLMTVGSVVPLVGWLVGIVLLWMSRWLRVWEKLLATLVVPGGIGGALYLSLVSVRSCVETGTNGRTDSSTCGPTSWWEPLLPALFVVLLIGSLVIPLVLLALARRRAARVTRNSKAFFA